jgi:hypothetical protein
MDYFTTETQPLDEHYQAFLIGGRFCLAAALVVAFAVFPNVKTSDDGKGIGLLLLLSAATCLINRGRLARMRIRNKWSAQ